MKRDINMYIIANVILACLSNNTLLLTKDL